MNIPIDVVVELLMANAHRADWPNPDGSHTYGEAVLTVTGQPIRPMLGGHLRSELRERVRTYLQSLVPPPKLLSECEEDVWQ